MPPDESSCPAPPAPTERQAPDFPASIKRLPNSTVLLAHCADDSKVGGLNRLRIRRLSLKDLTTP
jgi:hypothetical protein